MSRLTVDTITDEQIHELRSEHDPDEPIAILCNYALGLYASVHAARAHCAALINARAAGKETK